VQDPSAREKDTRPALLGVYEQGLVYIDDQGVLRPGSTLAPKPV
jgi:hypothetical protein